MFAVPVRSESMKRVVLFLIAASTATAAFAQGESPVSAIDVSAIDAPPASAESAAPRQMKGPVHIRFRKASDINLVAGSDMAEVQREVAYHAATRTEHAD